MRRPPNLSTSQWFRQNALQDRPWVADSSCGSRHDLPWISEVTPQAHQIEEMKLVCAACPVIKQCAGYAVTSGIDGGFYAGYWLPWSSQTESLDVKQIRAWARRRLKDVAGLPRIGRPSGPRQPYPRSTS